MLLAGIELGGGELKSVKSTTFACPEIDAGSWTSLVKGMSAT